MFFQGVPNVQVDRVWREGTTLHVAVHTIRRWARCPLCGRRSRRIRSHYDRTLADLPCGGDRVLVHLRVRRFACRVRWCRRRIFAERLPELALSAARQTRRLGDRLARLGFDLGGAPGERHARATGILVSRRTLLRVVRRSSMPPVTRVRVLGVDDWACRKGRTYGTILVDLEAGCVIDLLPDRTAETLAAWLRAHPEIEIISRDRGGAYAEAARQGAPQATQIADRWHILKNLTDALEGVLRRRHAAVRAALSPLTSALPAAADADPPGSAEGHAPARVHVPRGTGPADAKSAALCAL
jgi:transposase